MTYFPIMIEMQDTGDIFIVCTANNLPLLRPYKVLRTNVTAFDFKSPHPGGES